MANLGEGAGTIGESDHQEAQSNEDTLLRYWGNEVQRSIRRQSPWIIRGADVVDIYRGIFDDNNEVFNILWANTEVLKPTIYNHEPEPEVERTFLEADEIGETMAIVMERTLKQCMRTPGRSFHEAMKKTRDDMLLPGRGVMKACYDAEFEDEIIEAEYDEFGTETKAEEIKEKKVSEECFGEYVYWKDFTHSFGRMWEEVWWVAFAKNYNREQLIEEFGESLGKKIPLNGSIYDNESYYDEEGNFDYSMAGGTKEQFARVWEIWDKSTSQVIVIAEGYDDIIDKYDDPYNLPEFFPTPEPLYSIKTTGSLTPIPEYTMYQYQAEELNTITRRITRLTEGLKARGIADAEIKSLTRIFEGEDNEVIGDEEYSKLMASGGISQAISWIPIDVIANVLATLEKRRMATLELIYELTGISDIMRGSSEQYESATAVKKKGQYGSVRVRERQKSIQKYAQEMLNLMGSIVAELFDPETLIIMSGVENREDLMGGMEQVFQALQNQKMRDYTINIQTDSTIMATDFERKEELHEFFSSLSALMQQLIPGVQQGVIPMEVAKQFLLYAARRFEVGRDLVNSIDMIGQQPQEPQGGEEGGEEDKTGEAMIQVAQIQAQTEQMKVEQKQQEAEMDFQIKQAELQLKAAEMSQEAGNADADRQLKVAIELINLEIVKENRKGQDKDAN